LFPASFITMQTHTVESSLLFLFFFLLSFFFKPLTFSLGST
jgi:hypothetical protein